MTAIYSKTVNVLLQNVQNEEKIFATIVEHAKSLDIDVTPRVAGGWVRDKLMRLSTNDIDIALDNISGYDFAKGLEKKLNSKIGLIKENPSKSKHLETAVMNIDGMFIDFVNLRHEKYTTTRIPIICGGTPIQDALRRDLTINSLFYNLITEEIEDYTGIGIVDIRNKVLRTPMNPLITLYDDPLRILRIIRFYSKFQFVIDKSIQDAMETAKIKDALNHKVSRERVQTEVYKMCEYENGHLGMLEIIRLDYHEIIFQPDVSVSFDYTEAKIFYDRLESLANRCSIPYSKFVLKLYIVLHRYIGITQEVDGKREFSNVVIVRDKLLSSKKVSSMVSQIEVNLQSLEYFNEDLDRLRLVRLIRQLGKYWFESLAIKSSLDEEKKWIIDYILNNGYEEIHLTKPTVGGDSIAKELNLPKNRIRLFVEEGIAFQITNKNASRCEIIEYLKSVKKDLMLL